MAGSFQNDPHFFQVFEGQLRVFSRRDDFIGAFGSDSGNPQELFHARAVDFHGEILHVPKRPGAFRIVFFGQIFAVAKQDSPALAEGLLRFAGTEADPEDYPALLADLDVIVKEFGTVDLAELDIAAFLTALTQMAGRHNIEVPSTVTTVGRALVTLEGLLDEFIPDVNMIEIISDHIATSKSLKNATKDEIKSLGVEGHQALHATLGTMTELKTVARMLTRGQLRVNMELVGSEEPFQLLSDMVNRLTMALIVVGLFVGSSIVYYAGMKPIIFGIPVIGFMGYVVAFALGVWIVIDIYLKGRKTKKR